MKSHSKTHEGKHKPYLKLLIMAVLSFISMYILMYAMVDSFENVISNLNQVYMAALMACPMIIIELFLMKEMYSDKKLNITILSFSSLALAFFFIAIRKQLLISDKEFLKSMIPHHGAAILMCKETKLNDPEIKELCNEIIRGQEAEIVKMKTKLSKL